MVARTISVTPAGAMQQVDVDRKKRTAAVAHAPDGISDEPKPPVPTEVQTGCCATCRRALLPRWLEATFGNTDAWTYGGLWWPLQACHLPRKGLGWWAIMIVLGSLALGLLGLRFGVGIEESSVANDLYDCAALIWLLLFVLFVYDVLEFTDPVVGCPAKLLQSVRDAGVSYERCRSCLVIYCRLLACTLRLTVTIAGIIWIVVGLFQGFSGFGLWFAVGCLFAGIVIIPIVGTWVTSLFLCVDVAEASIQHIEERIQKYKSLSQDDFDGIDDATWRHELLEPTRELLRQHLPDLSRFGFSIGCVCMIAVVSAALSIPETVATFKGDSARDPKKALPLVVQIGGYLLFPVLLLVVPVEISNAAKNLAQSIHEMRPGGAGLHYDRVSALENYYNGVNSGLGPGFVVFGTCVTKAQLLTAGTSLVTVYPFVLYLVDEFV